MAGVGMGAQFVSAIIARESGGDGGGRQRCHWISSPFLPLPLPSARRAFKLPERRFQLLCYPVISLSAAGNSSLPPPQNSLATFSSAAKLYVSGLSFRTTEESLKNAFEQFGQLKEVNLVMDKIANRPRGFAFLRYATEEEAKKAIDGMHGKLQNRDHNSATAPAESPEIASIGIAFSDSD